MLRTIKIHWVEKARKTMGWGVKYWIIKGDTHKSVSHPVSSFTNNFKDALDHVQLFTIPRTVACQAPLSMGLSKQEYWSGLPIPSSRGSSQARNRTHVSCIAGRFFTFWTTRKVPEKKHRWKSSGNSTQLSKSFLL